MITSIKFEEKVFEGYSIIGDKNLDNLSKVNIFIGKNNSGKSRFLRLLLKNRLDIESKYFNSFVLNQHIEKLKKYVSTILDKNQSNPSLYHFHQAYEELPKITYANSNSEIERLKNAIEIHTNNFYNRVFDDNVKLLKEQTVNYINRFDEASLNFDKIYIPILRGLRPLQIQSSNEESNFVLSENNYLKRSIRDYEIKVSDKVNVHTGLDLYEEVTRHLLGDHDERIKIQNFEDYLSETFFQNQKVHIVPRIKKDVLYIKIGDEPQRPIYDLGEGIQAIILLTYPLFFNEGKKMLLFIEEPELHLHPGLERVLIETMRDKRFDTFQYFITTHSNHILDLTLEYDDISIYSFQKKTTENGNDFQIQNVNSEHKQVLDLLGVRNSSVFLANCTIWVEGITDRLYLRKYIELLQKENGTAYKEDYHYAFIEYAGSNITHWSFLESDDEDFANINIDGICSKVFLIVDNDGVELPDGKKKKKQERQEQLKQKLQNNFYVTKGREIENLLSKSTIKKVVESEMARDSTLDFTAFDKKDYSKSYIGDFIDKNVTGSKKNYSSDYGTIKDKVGFCKKAISEIESIEDLSEEAKELSGLVLDFIKSNNTKTY